MEFHLVLYFFFVLCEFFLTPLVMPLNEACNAMSRDLVFRYLSMLTLKKIVIPACEVK